MRRQFVHLETSTPVVKNCPRCGGPILAGLAEGSPVRVDIHPIGVAQEATAIAAGQATYTLRRDGLIHRDPCRRTDPALASPVLAEHRCPQPAPQPTGQQLEIDFTRRTA